ncbi:hypothetical protein ACT3UQ_19535, partial [Glutamicibacter sp. AOP12-B1-11]|uniref:hypothetical protein n=1 Tax=Glutamicibacter sp. AOP12-B1-11 TaxID=3457725 RepID=UPI00403472CF
GHYKGAIDGLMYGQTLTAWADYLSYDGNPYGVAFYAAWSYPPSDKSATLGRAWQSYLNYRR